ncbi:hypothetical protein [Oceanicaulis alexandrii]|uniref:hypothetical protein n=1 Tax=Oceanicaulis alexandrii TaxID=153233 RepID=UPI00040842C5|nr:hypothetical protein [Oceanicaulis alexandrii]
MLHTDDENDIWLDAFSAVLAEPSADERSFFEDRRQQGLGVGLDETGNLMHATSGPSTPPSLSSDR